MPYTYRPRSAQAWDKRANQSGGEFETFIQENFQVYRPKKGSNSVRILPPTFDDADHYGIDVHVHYSIGPTKASVLCLQRMKGTPCPICEARNRYLKIGDEEAANELRASKRVLIWMVDRNDEDRGPMLWPMPYTLDRDFSQLAKDKQSGEIYALDHPDDGYDIFFDRGGEGKLVQYTGKQLARRPSAVTDEVLDYVEERPLPATLIWRDYEAVNKLYEGGGTADPEPANPKPNGHGGANGAAAPTRRRVVDDTAAETPKRRVQADPPRTVPQEPEPARRRVAASDAPGRSRREQINEEVPLDDKHRVDTDAVEEPEPAAQTAAQRLRDRYRD